MRKCGVRGILGMIANLKYCIAIHPPQKTSINQKESGTKVCHPLCIAESPVK